MAKKAPSDGKVTKIKFYTDGSCLITSGKSVGPGGWSFVTVVNHLDCKGRDSKLEEESGAVSDTTNNRMELTAVIEAIMFYAGTSWSAGETGPCVPVIRSDSAYVVNAFNEGWLKRWKAGGWKTRTNSRDVANRDLWEVLDFLVSRFGVIFEKVKGHDGNEWNERADELARSAMKERARHDHVSTPKREPVSMGETIRRAKLRKEQGPKRKDRWRGYK